MRKCFANSFLPLCIGDRDDPVPPPLPPLARGDGGASLSGPPGDETMLTWDPLILPLLPLLRCPPPKLPPSRRPALVGDGTPEKELELSAWKIPGEDDGDSIPRSPSPMLLPPARLRAKPRLGGVKWLDPFALPLMSVAARFTCMAPGSSVC